MKKMEIEYLPISAIKPYENNPRNNEEAVEYVANSIREFGFKVPIIIDSDNVIVAGHTRLKASERLGLTEVPCIRADDLTEEQVRAYRLADNKVAELATWNIDLLNIELDNIDLDMDQFGFGEGFDISDDAFGTDFELPSGEKNEIEQMTFTLHHDQAELIRYAIQIVDECQETFGNTNKNGNALYEVVREWAEQRK